jgi:hypothetical protein
MKHPGHTYGGFVPAISERGMTVRVLIGTTSIQLSEDNRDSWVTCTTSAECKTIVTAVPMVMSGMDPHMITGNPGFGWFVEVDLIRWWVDAIEVRTLRRCRDLSTSIPKA